MFDTDEWSSLMTLMPRQSADTCVALPPLILSCFPQLAFLRDILRDKKVSERLQSEGNDYYPLLSPESVRSLSLLVSKGQTEELFDHIYSAKATLSLAGVFGKHNVLYTRTAFGGGTCDLILWRTSASKYPAIDHKTNAIGFVLVDKPHGTVRAPDLTYDEPYDTHLCVDGPYGHAYSRTIVSGYVVLSDNNTMDVRIVDSLVAKVTEKYPRPVFPGTVNANHFVMATTINADNPTPPHITYTIYRNDDGDSRISKAVIAQADTLDDLLTKLTPGRQPSLNIELHTAQLAFTYKANIVLALLNELMSRVAAGSVVRFVPLVEVTDARFTAVATKPSTGMLLYASTAPEHLDSVTSRFGVNAASRVTVPATVLADGTGQVDAFMSLSYKDTQPTEDLKVTILPITKDTVNAWLSSCAGMQAPYADIVPGRSLWAPKAQNVGPLSAVIRSFQGALLHRLRFLNHKLGVVTDSNDRFRLVTRRADIGMRPNGTIKTFLVKSKMAAENLGISSPGCMKAAQIAVDDVLLDTCYVSNTDIEYDPYRHIRLLVDLMTRTPVMVRYTHAAHLLQPRAMAEDVQAAELVKKDRLNEYATRGRYTSFFINASGANIEGVQISGPSPVSRDRGGPPRISVSRIHTEDPSGYLTLVHNFLVGIGWPLSERAPANWDVAALSSFVSQYTGRPYPAEIPKDALEEFVRVFKTVRAGVQEQMKTLRSEYDPAIIENLIGEPTVSTLDAFDRIMAVLVNMLISVGGTSASKVLPRTVGRPAFVECAAAPTRRRNIYYPEFVRQLVALEGAAAKKQSEPDAGSKNQSSSEPALLNKIQLNELANHFRHTSMVNEFTPPYAWAVDGPLRDEIRERMLNEADRLLDAPYIHIMPDGTRVQAADLVRTDTGYIAVDVERVADVTLPPVVLRTTAATRAATRDAARVAEREAQFTEWVAGNPDLAWFTGGIGALDFFCHDRVFPRTHDAARNACFGANIVAQELQTIVDHAAIQSIKLIFILPNVGWRRLLQARNYDTEVFFVNVFIYINDAAWLKFTTRCVPSQVLFDLPLRRFINDVTAAIQRIYDTLPHIAATAASVGAYTAEVWTELMVISDDLYFTTALHATDNGGAPWPLYPAPGDRDETEIVETELRDEELDDDDIEDEEIEDEEIEDDEELPVVEEAAGQQTVVIQDGMIADTAFVDEDEDEDEDYEDNDWDEDYDDGDDEDEPV